MTIFVIQDFPEGLVALLSLFSSIFCIFCPLFFCLKQSVALLCLFDVMGTGGILGVGDGLPVLR